jgi:hypothetical protein
MTERQNQMLRNYNWANAESLSKAYKKCSWDKIRAEKKILDEMYKIGGYGYRITGANTFGFSCAYKVKEGDKVMLVYHTAKNVHKFAI